MGSISNTSILNTGLDVQAIVDGLMQIEQQPVVNMQSKISVLQQKGQAYQSLNTKVSALLDKVNTLLFGTGTVPFQTPYSYQDRLAESLLAAHKVVSSDDSIITATTSQGTADGAYAITVSSLAQAKSMASANFADIDKTTLGTGTLSIQIGTDAPVDITLDSTNNTLDGLRKAINGANAGVTATIINDGSGTPYRLLITSKNTGLANAFTITGTPTGGQDLGLTQTAAAADAEFNVNGIDITKSANTVSDVIEGITFTLKARTATAVNLTVDRDIDSMVSAMKDMVASYNDLTSYINGQFSYNTTTKTAGILSGDSVVRRTQTQIQQQLTQFITNDFTDYHIVTELGLGFSNDGSLTLNESKLRDALTKNIAGVAGLLLGNGTAGTPEAFTSSDSRVTYTSKTSATLPGTYDVSITALAQQAAVVGDQAVSSLSQDETLEITSGGTTATVTLLSGDSLATVLDKINSELSSKGIAATAVDNGDQRIRIATNEYGSGQSIAVTSMTPGGSSGFGTTPASASGTDIEGTINGHAAAGTGLVLTGAAGQAEEGLKLTIAQSVLGSYGSITFTPAVAGDPGTGLLVTLQNTLDHITDPLSGPIHYATDGLNSNIKDLNRQISAYQVILATRRQLLMNEYSQADQALKMLSVNQAALNNQLSSL